MHFSNLFLEAYDNKSAVLAVDHTVCDASCYTNATTYLTSSHQLMRHVTDSLVTMESVYPVIMSVTKSKIVTEKRMNTTVKVNL